MPEEPPSETVQSITKQNHKESSVLMSIQFSQGKLLGETRRNVLKAIQKEMQESAVKAIAGVVELFLEEEVTAKLGRKKGQLRRVTSQVRAIDWRCAGLLDVMMPINSYGMDITVEVWRPVGDIFRACRSQC